MPHHCLSNHRVNRRTSNRSGLINLKINLVKNGIRANARKIKARMKNRECGSNGNINPKIPLIKNTKKRIPQIILTSNFISASGATAMFQIILASPHAKERNQCSPRNENKSGTYALSGRAHNRRQNSRIPDTKKYKMVWRLRKFPAFHEPLKFFGSTSES